MKQQDLIIEQDRSQIWTPESLKGLFLFKAQFKEFVFSKHVHEEFGIGVIEMGAQKFSYRGEMHFAPQQAMITVNPDMIHDGETATVNGYQYRVVYVHPELAQELLQEFSGPTMRYFKSPVTFDPEISQRLLYALRLLDQHPEERLEAQSCLFQAVADLFLRHAEPRRSPLPLQHNPAFVRKAFEFIHSHLDDDFSLDEIARSVGVSRFHFLRQFKAATGLSPHAYLFLRRLELAKRLIRQGFSLSQAAYEAGFADQSHMTRRFKSAYGFTPGQYRKAVFA